MKKIILIFSFVLAFGLNVQEVYYKSYNYEKMGDYQDAIKVLIPLYNEYPNGYTLNLRLGWLFFLKRNYKNAIEHLKKASLVYPYSLEPKLLLARVYLATGNFKDALNTTETILRADFYNFYGNYYEILALEGVKDYKSALKITQKMLGLYPTNVLYLTELGKIYMKLNKKDLAKKIFKDVLILDPNNIEAKKFLK